MRPAPTDRPRSRVRLLAAFAAIGILAALPSVSAAASAPRGYGLQYVTSLQGTGGTDIEFFSRTLTEYLAPDLSVVSAPEGVERHFAFVGNQSQGAKIADITNPEQPYYVASMVNCTVGQGDPQVRKDGMLATIAFQTSGSCKFPSGGSVPKGSVIVDLSDVYAPTVVGSAPESLGSHNNSLHPDGRYLYISTSGDAAPANHIPIYDLADPAKPVLVRKWVPDTGDSPHDIRFSADGKRAYLAGVDQFRIVNTEDPANPVLISTFRAPGSTIGHDALITPDKRFLFVGDEANGGGTFPCPGGAIYAYDLADEANPLLLGIAEAGGGPVTDRQLDEPGATTRLGGCTSHVMDLNPDGKSFTIGWYVQGTRVFDFSSFYNADGSPKSSGVLAASYGKYGVGLVEKAALVPDSANTWSAKQYHKVPGYVFSDDLNLGLYVSKLTS